MTASPEMGLCQNLIRIDGEPRYAVMFSAVYQHRCWKIVFLKASEVHETSLKASFLATVSTERYFCLFGLVGAFLHGLYRCRRPILLLHCWVVENAHKKYIFLRNSRQIKLYLYLMPMGYKLYSFIWYIMHSIT